MSRRQDTRDPRTSGDRPAHRTTRQTAKTVGTKRIRRSTVSRSVEPRGIATVPDVARAAGVSTATAARALGGYGSVRESTRERVQAAAEQLGYRANSLARSMITGSTRTLGVVMSDIENPFFRRSLRGIADTARAQGFEVLLANTDEELDKEETAVRVMTERRVDGLVVCPADGGDRSRPPRGHCSRHPRGPAGPERGGPASRHGGYRQPQGCASCHRAPVGPRPPRHSRSSPVGRTRCWNACCAPT